MGDVVEAGVYSCGWVHASVRHFLYTIGSVRFSFSTASTCYIDLSDTHDKLIMIHMHNMHHYVAQKC